jgi:hypothetical protein
LFIKENGKLQLKKDNPYIELSFVVYIKISE